MIRFSPVYLRQWFLIFLAFGGVSPRLGRQPHTRAHGARIRRNFVFGARYRFSSAHNITKRRAAEVACRSGGKRNVVHGANAPRFDWLAARLGRDPKRNSKKRFFARVSLDIDVECPSGPRPHLRRHLGRGATISANAAAGTWTLEDAGGTTTLSGSWSAEKFSTGWNGVWRAQSRESKVEYSGSWSADLPHDAEAPFNELFEAAARNAVRGVWTGGSQAGTWSIRAAS